MKRYRVWTKNGDGSYSIMNDWNTWHFCRKLIINRWGHWPPWAFISQAKNRENFIKHNGY